jgi:tyrosinase
MTSNLRLEWSARVRCNQHELGSSFSVLFFLVAVPENKSEWFTSPNFVGSFDAFVGIPDSSDHSQSDYDIEGFVYLNDAILKHNGRASLEPNVVVPFLTSNIHWRVQMVSEFHSFASGLESYRSFVRSRRMARLANLRPLR